MLFYDNEYGKNDGVLICCKFCDMPRYHDQNIGANTKKLVPVKTMFYLPNSKVAKTVCINGNY